MRIIKLMAKNIKNLKAIEITPDGNIVTLSGKNGAGKSAILDAIFTSLTGKRLKDPVRHGEERADVEVDMGDFIVRKRWTEKGEGIEVFTKNEEGKKVKFTSPQTFLDGVIGKLSFDPLEFQTMDSEAQVELLKQIVGLDFADLDKERDAVYQERTALNSRVKESIAHLQNTQAPDPDTPDEEIKFKDALDRVNDLREKQRVYQLALCKKDEMADTIVEDNNQIANIKDEIERLKNVLAQVEGHVASLQESHSKIQLPPLISDDDIRTAEIEIEGIEKKNADIRAAKRYRQAVKDADKIKKESDGLTEKLRRIEQDKHTRAAAAKMPIENLALIDDGVTYNGILFDSLSTGQQIHVSTAMGMALNPKLKVIFIREGSLLDSAGLKEIADMAKEYDYQIWLEKCDETGKVGFYLESGEITAKDGKSVEQSKESGEDSGQSAD